MARRSIIWDIERNKKRQRDKGFSAADGMRNLAEFYLQRSHATWPGFFTTIRLCLGVHAEAHLKLIGYQG